MHGITQIFSRDKACRILHAQCAVKHVKYYTVPPWLLLPTQQKKLQKLAREIFFSFHHVMFYLEKKDQKRNFFLLHHSRVHVGQSKSRANAALLLTYATITRHHMIANEFGPFTSSSILLRSFDLIKVSQV